MRFAEEIEEQEHADTEITLGMKSLLGIFFGLVLICGVFFGLGYSLGHGSTSARLTSHTTPGETGTASTSKPATPLPIAPPASEDDTAEPTTYTPGPDAHEPITSSAAPKPSATVIKQVVQQPTDTGSPTPSKPSPVSASSPTAIPAVAKTSPITPTTLPVVAAPTPVSQAASAMVQIAAVSHQEDAEVLVNALKKHGYNAVVRNDPKDSLLHVQIGPFASRDEARAMRAKLLADGYNAILK
jgi:DedD protein